VPLVPLPPLFHHWPNAVLAAVVMVAVSGLVDARFPALLWRQDKLEFAIWAVTMLTTWFVSLPLGIGVGMLLGLAMAVQRMMHPHVAVLGNVEGVFRNVDRFPEADVLDDVLVVRYDGALNFANQTHFRSTMTRLVAKKGDGLKLLVLQADTISYVDVSARATLRILVDEWQSRGLKLCLAGAIGPVRDALASDGLLDSGDVCFQLSVDHALEEFQTPGSVPQNLQDMAQQHR